LRTLALVDSASGSIVLVRGRVGPRDGIWGGSNWLDAEVSQPQIWKSRRGD